MGVIDVRQTAIHTAEPLVPEPNTFEFETVIENLKDRNHQVLIKKQQNSSQRGEEKYAQIHKLINSVQNKQDLPEEWKEWIILPFYKKGSKTDVVIIVEYYVGQLFTKFYPTSFCQDLHHT